MEFEKLPALTRREEDEPGFEAESWKPTWKCYCCHDTGFVLDRLAALVIDGYDSEKSKILYLTTQFHLGEQHQRTVTSSMQLKYCTSCY